MKKIKIFLASSDELKKERLEIADLLSHMNLAMEHENVRIYLVKWEYLDAESSSSRKNIQYEKTFEECDICIIAFGKEFCS